MIAGRAQDVPKDIFALASRRLRKIAPRLRLAIERNEPSQRAARRLA